MDKKVALIGASGFVGKHILDQLLSRGYSVEALVRNPEKITLQTPALSVKKVDVSDEKALAGLLKGYDLVISAYNPGWSNPNIASDTSANYPKIVQACKDAGVKRLLIVGGAGSLKTKSGAMLMDTDAISEDIKPAVKALGKFYLDTLRKEDGLDWVFFSPAAELFDDKSAKPTGKYTIGGDDLIVDKNGKSSISVQDYAEAMVQEAAEPKHHKTRITIGYLFP